MSSPIFQGNHGQAYRHPALNGAGALFVTVQMGWGCGSGKTGDKIYVQLSGMVTGDINQGVFFQSDVPITVDYTLQNPAIATDLDPDIQSGVLWDGAQAVPTGKMTKADWSVFTVCRVTMGGDGTFNIAVR